MGQSRTILYTRPRTRPTGNFAFARRTTVKRTAFAATGLVVFVAILWTQPVAQTQGAPQAQDVRALLQAVSKNIGADNLNTLEYTVTGMVAAPGQGYVPIPALTGRPES